MIRFKHITLILITGFMISCATTHPGVVGRKTTANSDFDLKISAKVVQDYSDEAHQFIDFTFENNKTNWERIESIEFEYGNEEDLVYNVIVGDDLTTWAKAFTARKSQLDHNKFLTFTGLMVAGAVLSGVSRDSGTQTAGDLTYAIGATGLASHAVKESHRNINTSKRVPKEHLLNGRFSVPAKMFVRKWVLVNVPGDRWATMAFLTVTTVDGRTEKYEVPINTL